MERLEANNAEHDARVWRKAFLALAIILSGALGFFYSIQAYPGILKTEITIQKKANINPAEPITINFSFSMPKDAYGSRIKVEPAEGVKLRWENSNRKLTIIPEKFWKPETEYNIYLPESRNILFAKTPATKVIFSTVSYPRVKSFFPENGAKDVLVDIEDPIIVNFDKSTEGFFIKFVLEPFSEMTYQNNPGKTEFRLLPKDKMEDGVRHEIRIYAKYAYDPEDNYMDIHRSSFETKPLPPVTWEKDYTLRLEQARKYTRAKIAAGKYIDINLSAQVLSVFEDGKLLDSYLVSTGKRGMDTPKGTWSILEKRQRPWSKKYALYMPWFMLFTRQGHGLHELPEWPGGYKEGANHLGIPVSHGCVRLGIGPAKMTYDWAEIGTPVVVY